MALLRWFVTFEPPTSWREGRVFHLDVSGVAFGGYPGPTTQVWLAFSPRTAPSGVTFSAYQTGARHRDIRGQTTARTRPASTSV